ncbi:MAG: DUF5659 domain-containing protein [Elusimicrobia bacterium]|nr:DUF5659 domain-containing protein [Candidatus Liberimonas magnetica]
MDVYRTNDLYESSLLYALGYKLVNTERTNGRISFEFGDKLECEATLKKYYSNDLKVKAHSFAESIRSIKSMLFRI